MNVKRRKDITNLIKSIEEFASITADAICEFKAERSSEIGG